MSGPDRGLVRLEECPVGLFLSENGELCLKTEYGNNEGRIDAYIVSTGEFFWGSQPQTIANQRAQLVEPIDHEQLLAPRPKPGGARSSCRAFSLFPPPDVDHERGGPVTWPWFSTARRGHLLEVRVKALEHRLAHIEKYLLSSEDPS